MKTTLIIEKGDDGNFAVYSDNLKNHLIFGYGETVEEAKEDFMSGLEDARESYTSKNEPVPEELLNNVFEYKYDVSSFLNKYDYINLSKFAKKSKISANMLRQYKAGQYISERRVKQIQDAIHNIGRELLAVELTV